MVGKTVILRLTMIRMQVKFKPKHGRKELTTDENPALAQPTHIRAGSITVAAPQAA